MTASDEPGVDIRFLGGNPDAEEIAAITAVLSGALDELAGEQRRRQSRGPSAWQRSQRNVRTPLVRGAWRTSER
ncbi:MAG: acyl-CoA carboxylase subunit epsilon [Schumannella sp.]|nr:acyl-CoA carboxylase subunit epsilon [Schumannella sp.]